jgi:hypothetical protein
MASPSSCPIREQFGRGGRPGSRSSDTVDQNHGPVFMQCGHSWAPTSHAAARPPRAGQEKRRGIILQAELVVKAKENRSWFSLVEDRVASWSVRRESQPGGGCPTIFENLAFARRLASLWLGAILGISGVPGSETRQCHVSTADFSVSRVSVFAGPRKARCWLSGVVVSVAGVPFAGACRVEPHTYGAHPSFFRVIHRQLFIETLSRC